MIWKEANSRDIVEGYVENYITHVIKGKPDEVQKAVESLNTKGKFSKFVRQSRERKFIDNESLEAWAKTKGLEVEKNAKVLDQINELSMKKAIAEDNFVKAIKPLKSTDGKPLIVSQTEGQGKGYIRSKNYAFSEVKRFINKQGKTEVISVPLYLHPELYNVIESPMLNVIGEKPWGKQVPLLGVYDKMANLVKRIIFYNPAIHGVNVATSSTSAVGVLKSIRGYYHGLKAVKNNSPIIREMIDAGVKYEGLGEMSKEIFDKILKQNKGLAKELGLDKVNPYKYNDVLLWDYIVKPAQVGVYSEAKPYFAKKMTKYAAKTGQKITEQDIRRATGEFTNNTLGTLPKQTMSQFSQELGSRLPLVRDWTYSNVRIGKSALPFSDRLGFQEKARQGAGAKALKWGSRKYLLRGLIYGLIFANILAYKLAGHSTFENANGDWFSIPYIDENGNERYIINPYRWVSDLMKLATRPSDYFADKIHPLPKTFIETLFNRSLFTGQQIAKSDDDKITQTVAKTKYVTTQLTPLRNLNEIKSPFEFGLMLGGMWTKSGNQPGQSRGLNNSNKLNYKIVP